MFSTGVVGLIILAIVVVLFLIDKFPGTVVALIGCVLLFIFCGQPLSVVFGGYSHSVTVLITASMAVGVAMFDTGTAQVIAKAVIRLSKNNELAFILGGALVAGVLSMWLANTAVVACFLPIIESVARSSGKMKRKNMTMSITFGAMYGGACTLVGSTPQITASGILSAFDGVPEIGIFGYMPVGLILFAWYMIYVALIGYPLGKHIWGDRKETALEMDESKSQDMQTFQVDKGKVILMLLIFAFMIIAYLLAIVPPAITATIAVILCIILKLTTIKSLIANIDWNVALMLGALLGFATGFEASGSGKILADFVIKILGSSTSPMLLLVIVTVASVALSNFCSNAATVTIFLPIAVPIAQSYGFSARPFAFAIVYGASFACSTPIAHSQITMTMVAGYRFSDYFKWTWILTLVTIVLILVFVPIFYPF